MIIITVSLRIRVISVLELTDKQDVASSPCKVVHTRISPPFLIFQYIHTYILSQYYLEPM